LGNTLRNHAPFFLSQGGEQVQNKRVYIVSQFCYYEPHALGHQATDEGDITGQAIQARD